MQRWAKFRHIPFAPSEVQNASKYSSVCQQERQRLQMAMGQISWGKGPPIADKLITILLQITSIFFATSFQFSFFLLDVVIPAPEL